MRSRPRPARFSLRGVVQVEALMVLLLLTLVAAASLTALGPDIVDWFAFATAWLALPVP